MHAEHRTERAEEVQRPAAKATQKERGEQVERCANDALVTVLGLAVRPRAVKHRNLTDPEALRMRERRNEAVQLPVQMNVACHLASVRLEATVVIPSV